MKKKNKKKMSDIEYLIKQLKITNRFIWFLFAIILFQFILLLILVYPENFSSAVEVNNNFGEHEVDIEYKNLTEFEIEHVNSLLTQINTVFLFDQQKIIILKDMTPVCEGCGGANVNAGEKIFIKYSPNDLTMKKRITHELMHTYLRSENPPDWEHPLHRVVFELASQEVAFK